MSSVAFVSVGVHLHLVSTTGIVAVMVVVTLIAGNSHIVYWHVLIDRIAGGHILMSVGAGRVDNVSLRDSDIDASLRVAGA